MISYVVATVTFEIETWFKLRDRDLVQTSRPILHQKPRDSR